MGKRDIISLFVPIAVLVGIVILILSGIIVIDDRVIELSVLFVLALATVFYAYRTSEIANSAREQLLSEARPYIVLRLEKEVIDWGKTDPDTGLPSEFKVEVRNVGKGPAINLRAFLWKPDVRLMAITKGYLAYDECWSATINRTDILLGLSEEERNELESSKQDSILPDIKKVVGEDYEAVVAVRYDDIHNRSWLSYLCLARGSVRDEIFCVEDKQNILRLSGK